jgi:hypothetical protein
MTRPVWSFTVTMIRPRRGASWAADGHAAPCGAVADAAGTAAADHNSPSTTATSRGGVIYFVAWNFFASILGLTLYVSTIISSVGLPSMERWIRCGSSTPPTLL